MMDEESAKNSVDLIDEEPLFRRRVIGCCAIFIIIVFIVALLVGYTSCDGCPGGNVEDVGEEMVKNGAQVIHLATGMVVGYPPCPFILTFKTYLEKRYGVEVVVGTHPIPKKYLEMHKVLGNWSDPSWEPLLAPVMGDEVTREAYD